MMGQFPWKKAFEKETDLQYPFTGITYFTALRPSVFPKRWQFAVSGVAHGKRNVMPIRQLRIKVVTPNPLKTCF